MDKLLDRTELTERARVYDSKEYFYTSQADSVIKRKGLANREAAVLIPLTFIDNRIHVVLTVRSNHVRTYKGEVAFPGGIREPQDKSPIETALREAYEEIGLPIESVNVIACLPPIITRLNILLFPVIGLLEDFENFIPAMNPMEVSKCFHIPFDRFLSNRGHTVHQMTLEGTGKRVQTHSFEDKLPDGDTVVTFGITAVICTMAAAGLYRRQPEYEYWIQFPNNANDETAWRHCFDSTISRYRDTINESTNNVSSKI